MDLGVVRHVLRCVDGHQDQVGQHRVEWGLLEGCLAHEVVAVDGTGGVLRAVGDVGRDGPEELRVVAEDVLSRHFLGERLARGRRSGVVLFDRGDERLEGGYAARQQHVDCRTPGFGSAQPFGKGSTERGRRCTLVELDGGDGGETELLVAGTECSIRAEEVPHPGQSLAELGKCGGEPFGPRGVRVLLHDAIAVHLPSLNVFQVSRPSGRSAGIGVPGQRMRIGSV